MWIGPSLPGAVNTKGKTGMLTKLILVFVLFILTVIEFRQ